MKKILSNKEKNTKMKTKAIKYKLMCFSYSGHSLVFRIYMKKKDQTKWR